jgi:intracellular multiplication protein IcmC
MSKSDYWVKGFIVIAACLLLSGCGFGLQNALSNWDRNYAPLVRLVTALSYLLGVTFIFRAVFQLKQYGEMTVMRASGTSIKGPMILFVVGAALLFFPSTKSALLMSTFGYGQQQQLQYVIPGAPLLDSNSLKGLLHMIQLVGFISFLRGWTQLAHLSNPSGQYSVGKALTHIIGGIMAINIQGTTEMLQATFGPS